METKPLISVIIPTLNEEKLLPRLLSQFPSEFRENHRAEVIVSDGGSTDQTVAIAKAAGARVIQNKPGEKRTIGGQRNFGASIAKGEIFIFLDADGYPKNPADFLKKVHDALRDQEIVGLMTRVEIPPQERKLRDIVWEWIFNAVIYLMSYVVGGGRGNCQIVRAQTFRAIGGYDEKITVSEDTDLFQRLYKQGKVELVWDLVVYESPRRYRRYGYLWISISWVINFISARLFGRAYSKEWKRV